MDTAIRVERTTGRTPLSALAKWTVTTLVVGVVLLIYMQVFLVRDFMPPIALMFGVPALIFAALVVAIRRRWAPLLGALYWVLFLAANAPYIVHDLSHTEFFGTFMFSVILMMPPLVGLAAGIGAAVQNYRTPDTADPTARGHGAPRWFPTGLATVTGLCAGAILVGALPNGSAAAAVSASALAGLPALTAAQHRFDKTELRVKAGQTVALRLENQDAAGHSFDIDEFKVHVPMVPGQPGLALFIPTTPGRYTFYCSVPGHRAAGMVGTLVVEP